MKKLFLDANILFSVAYREKPGLLKLWELNGVKLISSHYAIEEARRNLKQSVQLERLEKLVEQITVISETKKYQLPENINLAKKDQPILAAAILVKADYLITGDYKDFGQFFGKKIQGVKILPPAEYLKNNV